MSATLKEQEKPPLWEWDGPELDAWMMKTMQEAAADYKPNADTLQLWYRHVLTAVQAIQLIPVPEQESSTEEERPAKRRRRRQRFKLQDPYHIWWISRYTQKPEPNPDDDDDEEEEEEDDLPTSMGGRMAQFSSGAWFNALIGFVGGVVHKANPTATMVKADAVKSSLSHPKDKTAEQYATEMWHVAQAIHRIVQAAVQKDIWRTTPMRIQQRLAPDISQAEFQSIRKRVYETVILGKGLHVGDEDESEDMPVAPVSAVHDIEKYKKCPNCGNLDQSSFALDRKNGDIICSNCGVVVTESLMHEGSAYRKFEGEADRNHHGDAPNSLYSNAHNLGTSLSGVAPTAGAGIGGWGSNRGGGGGNLETILRNTHAYTELNVSQYGKTERRTRVGYKDRQKKEAFVQMTHAGDALNLHEAVVQRAKELFAGFRDDRELVQQFKGVLAACLCEAFEQLAAEGKDGFLVKGVGASTLNEKKEEAVQGAVDEEPVQLSGRAARRKELHSATFSGKGGLQLDLDTKMTAEDGNVAGKDSGKPAATWDLEDCRSWLLEASRRIAQQWVEDRQAAPAAKKKNWPTGSLEELEGKLVEHSIVLCEHLEKELQSRSSSSSNKQGSRRVVTPRVLDMSKLGIKWQHAHERGSGGKGGVGGNVQTKKTEDRNQRKAGQILLLKTAKKLSSILNDPLAGQSIHKELRSLIGKQEEKKRQKLHEEASRQRFQQMQRKPWLKARAQIES